MKYYILKKEVQACDQSYNLMNLVLAVDKEEAIKKANDYHRDLYGPYTQIIECDGLISVTDRLFETRTTLIDICEISCLSDLKDQLITIS